MEFRALVDELLAEYFRLDPVHATEIGNHEHDGAWPDLTDAGRASRLAFAEDAIRRMGEVDVASLSRDDAIDHRILSDAFAAMRFFSAFLCKRRSRSVLTQTSRPEPVTSWRRAGAAPMQPSDARKIPAGRAAFAGSSRQSGVSRIERIAPSG